MRRDCAEAQSGNTTDSVQTKNPKDTAWHGTGVRMSSISCETNKNTKEEYV